MDKLSKVRADIERLIEQTKPYLGACAGQVVAEANSKIAAYNDVLCILDSMQKEPESHKPKITLGEATGKLKELLDNMKDSAAKDLGLSEEDYNKAIDECLYGKEPELVDDGDLPKEEPVSEIDFEQELYKYFGQVKDFTLGMRIAKRFYEIGLLASNPLTWEDVKKICVQSVLVEIDLGGKVSDERHYTEVLKRFKVEKGE